MVEYKSLLIHAVCILPSYRNKEMKSMNRLTIFRIISSFCLGWGLLLLLLPQTAQAQNGPGAIYIAEIQGVINTLTADYLTRTLTEAANENAQLLVLKLDTPGGLVDSTRQMTQQILGSDVPVAVYVSPAGAHAASAGLFILVSGHVAAMAPGTNTGAAHPVGMGGEGMDEVMTEKVVNDAAASIRALAEAQGRNAAWAEQAVRESVSVTEREALNLNVIDLVAADLDDLLAQIDGWTINTAAGDVTLNTANAPRRDASMNIFERFLHVITNPNLAFILLSIGSIGIIAELYNPGALAPGITGVISLILAFYALGSLPTNWAGVILIILAMGLFIAELSTDGSGILGTGAVIAFVLGGMMLFRPFQPESPILPALRVNPWVLGASTASLAAFVFLVIGQVMRSRKSPLQTGYEQYAGQLVRVHQKLEPEGRVWFEGQPWNARLQESGAADSKQKASSGEIVRIVKVDGLTLIVEPVEDNQET